MLIRSDKYNQLASRQRSDAITWLILSLVLIMLNAVPPILQYRSGIQAPDLAQTIYNSREIVIGRLPYKDIVSHHFMLYLMPFVVVEWIAGLSRENLMVMQFCYQILAAFFVCRLSRELSASKIVPWISALLVSTVGWYPELGGHLFNYQSNLMPLFCWYLGSVLAANRTKSLSAFTASGTLAGLLTLCDQRMIIFAPLAVLSIFSKGNCHKTKKFCGFCIATCAPLVIAIVALFFLGALDDAFFQTIQFPLVYRNAGTTSHLMEVSLSMIQVAFLNVPSFIFYGFAILLIFIREKVSFRFLFLSCGGLLSIVYVILGSRAYLNYLLYLGFFAIIGTATLFENTKKGSYRYITALILVALQCQYFLSLNAYRSSGHDSKPMTELIDFVTRQTTRGENILVWGSCGQIYNQSSTFTGYRDMSLLSIAGSVFHGSGAGSGNVVPEMLEEFRQYMKETPPRLVVASLPSEQDKFEFGLGCLWGGKILDNRAGLGFFRQILAEEYKVVFTRSFDEVPVAVYERLS